MVVTALAFVALVVFWLAMHLESNRHFGMLWGWVGRPPSREHMYVKLVLEPTARRVTQMMNEELIPVFAEMAATFTGLKVVFDESPLFKALEEMGRAE